MSRTITLSLTLIALSAGAGLGLSYLHKASVTDDVSTLQQPSDAVTSTSGFVLPEFVPARTALPTETPHQPVAPDVTATINPTTEPDNSVSAPAPVAPVQAEKAPTAPTKTHPRKKPVLKYVDAPEPAYKPTRRKARAPIGTAQNFARPLHSRQPDYVVGVYR